MGFPAKNIGAGCHFLLQGIFPNPGIRPVSPALAGGFFTAETPRKLFLGHGLLQVSSQGLAGWVPFGEHPDTPSHPLPF